MLIQLIKILNSPLERGGFAEGEDGVCYITLPYIIYLILCRKRKGSVRACPEQGFFVAIYNEQCVMSNFSYTFHVSRLSFHV